MCHRVDNFYPPFFSALEYFDNNLFVFLFSGKLCCFYILNNKDATIPEKYIFVLALPFT